MKLKVAIPSTLFLAFVLMLSIDVNAQVQSWTFKAVLHALLSKNVPAITVADASKSANKYLFLDAREADEFRASHILGAKLIGAKNFALSALKDVSKDKSIVVYCSIGKRSEGIAEKMIKAGYKNTYNLYGGIFEWVNEGHSIVDVSGKPTANVHAYNHFWGMFLSRGRKVY